MEIINKSENYEMFDSFDNGWEFKGEITESKVDSSVKILGMIFLTFTDEESGEETIKKIGTIYWSKGSSLDSHHFIYEKDDEEKFIEIFKSVTLKTIDFIKNKTL